MIAARQWRLAWVLRVVPGTQTIDERADRPMAWLNTCRRNTVSQPLSLPGSLEREASRSEGMGSGEPTPSGGGLTTDTTRAFKGHGVPSRFEHGATAMDWATATGEPVAAPSMRSLTGGSREHTAEREQGGSRSASAA